MGYLCVSKYGYEFDTNYSYKQIFFVKNFPVILFSENLKALRKAKNKKTFIKPSGPE